jgi:RAB protein geranylgeranyltransferase component A
MSVLGDFQEWKEFLHDRVNQAENFGISKEKINGISYQLGDYLAKHVDPKNSQERVLKDLWSVANEDEQRTIASLMVKLVDSGSK